MAGTDSRCEGNYDGWIGDRYHERKLPAHGHRGTADLPAKVWPDVSCELLLFDWTVERVFGGGVHELVFREERRSERWRKEGGQLCITKQCSDPDKHGLRKTEQ